ncbi:MAG: histidine phosphatase family protein, partial [Solirubrobacterales bacterium]
GRSCSKPSRQTAAVPRLSMTPSSAGREGDGNWLFVAHGHVLRVVGARWVGLPAEDGVMLNLGTAAVCLLGFEHDRPVITLWNETGQIRSS